MSSEINETLLKINTEEIARRREISRLNYQKRKEAGITYPAVYRYVRKVQLISDEEKAKRRFEKKRLYGQQQNAPIKQQEWKMVLSPRGPKPENQLIEKPPESSSESHENLTVKAKATRGKPRKNIQDMVLPTGVSFLNLIRTASSVLIRCISHRMNPFDNYINLGTCQMTSLGAPLRGVAVVVVESTSDIFSLSWIL